MRRYLLFDLGCSYCTNIAHRIESLSGGWLIAKALDDPAAQAYLAGASDRAVHEPVLVEISDGVLRRYRGVRLRLKLLQGLGARRALAVLRCVFSPRSAGYGVPGVDRRSFLRRVATLAGGVAVLSGVGGVNPAQAAPQSTDWLERLRLIASSRITGASLRHLAATIEDDEATQQMLALGSVPHGLIEQALDGLADQAEDPDRSQLRAALHTTADGKSLLAVAAAGQDQALGWYELKQGDAVLHRRGMLYDYDDDTLTLRAMYDDGRLLLLRTNPAPSEAGTASASSSCTSDADCPEGGQGCYVCRCVRYDRGCALDCCGGTCLFACASNAAVCLACVLVYCPACLSIKSCCISKGCVNVCS